jgi:sensor histidine kinase YesM
MIPMKTLPKAKLIPLHIALWVLVWLFYANYFGFNSNNEKYIFWFSSVLMPVTIANTYFSIYYLIPKFLLKKKYGLFVLYGVYALIGSAYIVSISMFFGFIYLSELNFMEMPPLSRSLPYILMSMYLVVIIVSAFKLAKHNYLSMEKQKSMENIFLQTQLQLKKEELKFLKMQVHPHFLFNTLNTLYGFALKKADETPEMILKLSNLLDYILYQIDKPLVPLSEELNHIEDYISLEKMRFNESLKVDFKTNDVHLDYQIAPMLLIPFVENSFKHGSLIKGILTISIEVSMDGNELTFCIKNSHTPEHKETKGIGLENIKKRLEALYPNQYSLEIKQTKNEFEVIMKLRKK